MGVEDVSVSGSGGWEIGGRERYIQTHAHRHRHTHTHTHRHRHTDTHVSSVLCSFSWGVFFFFLHQNFVLNFNLFSPGQPLQPNTVVMVEQIPGFIVATDVSAQLQAERYFGSYNVAFNPDIRSLSFADKNADKYGSWFTYNGTARALIFARNHTDVVDMETMQALMRYNNYKHDPLSSQMQTCAYLHMSNCTPSQTTENTIATRGDLNPKDGVYGLSAFGQRNHVATDSKITSFSTFNATSLPIRAICGPPYEQVPVFQWSTSPYSDLPHHGMPDVFKFPWVTISWPESLAN